MFRAIFILAVVVAAAHSQPRYLQFLGNTLKNGLKQAGTRPLASRMIPLIPARMQFSAQSPLASEQKEWRKMEMIDTPKSTALVEVVGENADKKTDFHTSMYNELAKRYGLSTLPPITEIEAELAAKRAKWSVEKVWPPNVMDNIGKAAVLKPSTDAASKPESDQKVASEIVKMDTVVLGGTFDHLHAGHKHLLTEAVRRANKRVLVGVTDAKMVEHKLLYELIEPLEVRKKNVLDFLKSVDPTLTYEINVIHDDFGGTKTDANLDILVVSKETLNGAEQVNELRRANNLPALRVDCIDLIEHDDFEPGREKKLSSSQERMEVLGTRLKEPDASRPYFPNYPYVIGLTGGAATNVHKLGLYFNRFGAALIDGNKLARNIYEPDTECHTNLVKHFGVDILDENRQITQTKLNALFIADKKKIEEFNDIVWPSLKFALQQRIEEIRRENVHDIIVVEADSWLKAGWQRKVHEVWSIILPRKDAIEYMLEHYRLSENEASLRIAAQPTNEEMVKESTVVFSTKWSDQFLRLQAERAWDDLQKHLAKLKSES